MTHCWTKASPFPVSFPYPECAPTNLGIQVVPPCLLLWPIYVKKKVEYKIKLHFLIFLYLLLQTLEQGFPYEVSMKIFLSN